MSLSKEELQKIVAIGLLTDGNVYYRRFDNKYSLRFYSSDKSMHDYFQDLVLSAFGEKPSAFLKFKRKNLWATYYGRGTKNSMIQNLLALSKTYNTTKGKKPSLRFLLSEREEVRIQALRFAMSCDGSVSIKNPKKGKTAYLLRLACAHPSLANEFKALFQSVGIEMNIDRDNATWSGIHGLSTGRKKAFIKFAEMGGFAPTDVKVTNGKFIGVKKNEVLNKITKLIEVKKDERAFN